MDSADARVADLLQRVANDLAEVKQLVDDADWWGIVEAGRVGGTLSLMSDGLPRIANELGLAAPTISNDL